MTKGLRVQVTDLETGEVQTVEIPMGEYFVLTTSPCWVAHTQIYKSGKTVILTIKDRVPR